MSDPMSFAPDTNYEDHEFMKRCSDVVAICEDCTAIYDVRERSKCERGVGTCSWS